MKAMRSRIAGVGSFLPPRRVTNDDLQQYLETTDEWVAKRTGIRERRWADAEVATSDLALQASLNALKDAQLEAKDLDLIVFATLSPDHDFPGTGCFLQAKLGIAGVPAFDIRQQCSGFLYGLALADQFIRGGSYRHVLVVGAEIHSKGLDITTRGRDVAVLFGDGAGAAVVSRCEAEDNRTAPHILSTHLHADGSSARELWMPAPGTGFPGRERRFDESMFAEGLHFPKMNGKKVFIDAVQKMAEAVNEAVSANGYQVADVDLFLFHQANLRINEAVAKVLEIPAAKIFNTIQKYGNTTAATIPIGMRDALDEGKLRSGMLVGMAAFGSGYTWASALLRY